MRKIDGIVEHYQLFLHTSYSVTLSQEQNSFPS